MKYFLFFPLLCLLAFTPAEQTSFYSLQAETIDGEPFDFASLKGKKVIVVNTASECGYTPQYAELQQVYDKYKNKGLVIIGFPANDFGAQEPGSNADIKGFCQKNYGVTFPMMAKVVTKGEGQHPVYQWLTQAERNGKLDSQVKWNFQKYLINEQGELVDVAYSKEKPDSERIIAWIEGK